MGCGCASRSPSDAAIEKALQGNLCRCTGYAPIVRAAHAISDYGTAGERSAGRRARGDRRRRSRRMHDGRRVEIGEGRRRLIVPASVDDLADMLASRAEGDHRRRLHRCGAVGHQVHARHRAGDLHRPSGGAAGDRTRPTACVSIGAGVTYTEAYRRSRDRIPPSAELWDRIGGEQVRNMGTIGGNIANGSPIGDTPPPLIALGAQRDAAQGQEPARGAARRFLHRLWQAGPAARRVRRERRRCRCRPGTRTLPATRSPSAATRIFRRSAARSAGLARRRHGRHDRASPLAAWRRRRSGPSASRRRWSASRGRRRRSRPRSPAFADGFQPLTDMRASAGYRLLVAQNLLRRFFLETQGGQRADHACSREAAA